VQIVAVFFLASAAIGGVVYVFLYPMLSGERKTEQRIQSVAGTIPTTRATRGPQKSRRDAIESTLKDFDERHKKSKSVPLSTRIARAGLSWSKRQFATISAGIGLAMSPSARLLVLACWFRRSLASPEPLASRGGCCHI
jgi:tight adherence protein B